DAVGRVQVVQAHRDRDEEQERAPRPLEPVLGAFFLLDELFGALDAGRLDDRLCGRLRVPFGHGPSPVERGIIDEQRQNKKPRARRGFGRRCRGQFSLTPFSAKYLIAPGWNGIGEAPFVWLLSSKFCASLWTRISSSRLSKIVFTTLYATWSGMSARAMIRFQTVTTWLGRSCPGYDFAGIVSRTYSCPYFLFIASAASAWSISLSLTPGVAPRSVTAEVGMPPTQK